MDRKRTHATTSSQSHPWLHLCPPLLGRVLLSAGLSVFVSSVYRLWCLCSAARRWASSEGHVRFQFQCSAARPVAASLPSSSSLFRGAFVCVCVCVCVGFSPFLSSLFIIIAPVWAAISHWRRLCFRGLLYFFSFSTSQHRPPPATPRLCFSARLPVGQQVRRLRINRAPEEKRPATLLNFGFCGRTRCCYIIMTTPITTTGRPFRPDAANKWNRFFFHHHSFTKESPIAATVSRTRCWLTV